MNKRMITTLRIALSFKLSITLLYLVIQATSIAKENKALGSHVHGLSEMTIAVENQTLEIELISPAMNLVGFEHKAETKTDITAVKKAESLLKHSHKMFSFSGGNCKLIKQSIDISSIKSAHHHTEHAHEHKHEYEQHHENSHNEVIAHYYYHCEKSSELTTITVTAFDLFSGIEQIHTMWLTEVQQSAAILSTKNNVINLR